MTLLLRHASVKCRMSTFRQIWNTRCSQDGFRIPRTWPFMAMTIVSLSTRVTARSSTPARSNRLLFSLLRKSALSYEHPATLLCSERLTPTEAARLERCRTLLFVITDTSRAPAHMTMAAHYIGRGASVVLCIQMLPDNCVIQGEKVSIAAVCGTGGGGGGGSRTGPVGAGRVPWRVGGRPVPVRSVPTPL